MYIYPDGTKVCNCTLEIAYAIAVMFWERQQEGNV